MAILRELLETGKLTPIIDRVFPSGEVSRALRRLESGDAIEGARIGNNLDQPAYMANLKEEIEREEELRAVLDELAAAVRHHRLLLVPEVTQVQSARREGVPG